MDNVLDTDSYQNSEREETSFIAHIFLGSLGLYVESIVSEADILLIRGLLVSDIEVLSMKATAGKQSLIDVTLEKSPETSSYRFSHLIEEKTLESLNAIGFVVNTKNGIFHINMKDLEYSANKEQMISNPFNDWNEIIHKSRKTENIVNSIAYTIPHIAMRKIVEEYKNLGQINLELLETHNISLAEVLSDAAQDDIANALTPDSINEVYSRIRTDYLKPKFKKSQIGIKNKHILKDPKDQKIAIVTTECEFVTERTQWAVYVHELAKKYSAHSHVSIFVIPDHQLYEGIHARSLYYKEYFRNENIHLQILTLGENQEYHYRGESISKSYCIYDYLKNKDFDYIAFEGMNGLPYYSMLSKSLEDGFKESNLYVIMNDSILMNPDKTCLVESIDVLFEVAFMEKASMEMAGTFMSFDSELCKAFKYNASILASPKLIQPFISRAHIEKKQDVKSSGSYRYFSYGTYDGISPEDFNFVSIVEIEHTSYNLDSILGMINDNEDIIVLDSRMPDLAYIITYLNSIERTFLLTARTNGSIRVYDHAEDIECTDFDFYETHVRSNSIHKPQAKKNNHMPLVSICIPTRNRVRQLRKALDSIGSSTYRNVEVIVVDDGSDDVICRNTLKKIAEEYTEFPISFIEEDRRYPGFARNVASAFGKGKYLFFLDDDNELFPDTLERLVSVCEKQELDILTCCLEYSDPTLTKKTIKLFLGADIASGVFKNNFGDTFSLFKRSAFIEIGGFDTTPLTGNEDWELFARASILNYSITVHPSPMGAYFNTLESYNKRANSYIGRKTIYDCYNRLFTHSIKREIPYITECIHMFNNGKNFESKGMREKFDDSKIILLSLKGAELEKSIVLCEDTKKNATPSGVEVSSKAGDPQILIPNFQTDGVSRIAVYIKLLSCRNDTAQLFFLKKGETHFTEHQQYSMPVREGLNSIYFEINNIGIIVPPLRFDPGFSAGKYIIELIEIRGLDGHTI